MSEIGVKLNEEATLRNFEGVLNDYHKCKRIMGIGPQIISSYEYVPGPQKVQGDETMFKTVELRDIAGRGLEAIHNTIDLLSDIEARRINQRYIWPQTMTLEGLAMGEGYATSSFYRQLREAKLNFAILWQGEDELIVRK
ncbi:hypothetical protein ACX3VT_01270 [Aerococcus sanguinicola]|uniref:hypothetical protein n=1 Tax=unclassified Aerococcus TaxID=2618060 RepID=UPI0008A407D7|nr:MULTISPECIES: hypothetical protein [unclassified Aerococcus]MDK6856169.1 hypothetical protein [Aerococcus sp. UMB7533]OFN02435.1 hypothetical protein HMPREF2626_06215 [Aerococcus sp. HMSC062A02]OHO45140.1 hypothetical protein HMPREF2705_00940 [Aerococcus sp. HMSC035B07]